jgi:D-alanine-D-alanine ligase
MIPRIAFGDKATVQHATQELRDWAQDLPTLNVGLIYGGVSAEDRLYIAKSPLEQLSITALTASLSQLGTRFTVLDPCNATFIQSLSTYDVALSNLHGPFGEDGRLQGMLDYLRIPYCGSGVAASAVAADKVRCKWAMNNLGIPTPEHQVWHSGEPMLWPGKSVMIKPSLGGSSVGMSLVHHKGALAGALGEAWATDPSAILIEEYIPGIPVTVGLLELKGGLVAFPPFAQTHSGEWCDASDKLDAGGTNTPSVTIAELPDTVVKTLINQAHALWDGLGCRGMARVDSIVTDKGEVFALEVNTIPGMSRQSNFMISAAASGFDYNDVVRSILREATTRIPYDVPLPHPTFAASTTTR